MMKLEFIPLLRVQRDLYGLPRGPERFRTYLATMIDPQTNDLRLPLVAMNPMGKGHVPNALDEYLAHDADALAARAVSEAEARLAPVPGEFKVTLVLADDAMGGWTDRYSSEFACRFESGPYLKRGWITGTLWTSEVPCAQRAREEVLAAVYRTAHIQRLGCASTLGEMLAQEGYAMAMGGCTEPTLEEDELEYTRHVIAQHLGAVNRPVLMACLFGDEAADRLGYASLGLSERAGFALALHDARIRAAT